MVTKRDADTPADKQIPGIISEIESAAGALAHIGPAVSIFGSARIGRDSPYYAHSEALGTRLAEAGFAVIAGGGPGIMEAANKGAFDAGGTSVGLNIVLEHEAAGNPYQTIPLSFEYFYSRKATFFMHSMAYVALPGGYGTLDELFEALTLIQTGKVPAGPVILIGSEFWNGLERWIRERMLPAGMVSERDMGLFCVEDDPAAAVARIVRFHRETRVGDDYAPSLPA